MRNFLNKLGFAIRYIYRNITHFRLRSLLLLFTFVILLIITFLGLSVRPIVETYFYEKMVSKYGDIDFYMTVNQNTQARYFSIRELKEREYLDDKIENYVPFFQIQTLLGVEDENIYVNVMSSSIIELKKIAYEFNYNKELAYNEAIITNSLAKKYQLEEGSTVVVYVGEVSQEYEILEIVEDGGLFQGDTIFLNKEYSIMFFLSAINPSLSQLNPEFFVNFYNIVYFNVKENVEIQEAKDYILSMNSFKNLEFQNAINYEQINNLVDRTTTLILIIFIFIYFAVFLVMQTTVLLLFESKKRSFSIFNILGGSKLFSFILALIELLFIYGISLIISIFIASNIIKIGMSFFNINESYKINYSYIIYSAIIVVFLIIATSIYYFIRLNNKSVEQTKEIHDVTLKPIKIVFILMFAIIFYIALGFIIGRNNVTIIAQLFIIFILLFLIAFLLVFIMQKGINLFRNSFMSLQLKIILSKTAFYHFSWVLLICFVSIFLLVQTNYHENRTLETIESEYKVDFVLTNIITRFDQITSEISTLDSVKDSDSVLFYSNVLEIESNENINYFFSITPSKINDYFNLNISEDALEKLSNSESAVILLPQRYHELYNYNIGDSIELYISPVYPKESFIIGGFFEKKISDIAFSNILFVEKYQSEKPNSIFVNAISNPKELKENLIHQYSKNLIYILDFQEIIIADNQEVKSIITFINYLIVVIIGCFMLAIFNHSQLLFEQMKSSYSRIYVLGASKRKIIVSVFIEQFIFFLSYIISSIICIIMINQILPEFIKMFGEYENITLIKEDIFSGIIISAIIYFLSRIIYILRLTIIKSNDIIKSF